VINKLIVLILTLTLITITAIANTKVRRVIVIGDQVVTVRTALGIATIIQVPDRPNSVVVGDQDAFKVEYLDQAVTIKPLQAKSKTNIYIYTDWKRYNVELVSGPEAMSDYVVYLENTKEKDPTTTSPTTDSTNWIEYKNSLKNDDISLETKRLAKLKNGLLLIEFTVHSDKKQIFKPEWIWLTQGGKTRSIHNLMLSSLELNPNQQVEGVLQVLGSDIESKNAFKIEIRRKKISYLKIKKVDSWK
jgi:hypothetical protein